MTDSGSVLSDSHSEVASGKSGSEQTRRKFLGAVGGGVVTALTASGTVSGQQTPTISVGNNYFDPVGLAIDSGTTVRFEIANGSHSVTAYDERIPSGASSFDSGTISSGGFEHAFDTPGTHDYYCIPHESMGMTGRIVVGEPGGPAEASPIPNGTVPGSDDIVEHGTVSSDQVDKADATGHGGMMDSNGGMAASRSPGWRMLIPVGLVTTVLGAVGGGTYWLSKKRGRGTESEEDAVATVKEEYARGAIDTEELEQRVGKLNKE